MGLPPSNSLIRKEISPFYFVDKENSTQFAAIYCNHCGIFFDRFSVASSIAVIGDDGRCAAY